MSSIQTESLDSRDTRTAENGLLTREGQRLNHNSCEKLRRNLYRSILQNQLIPLIPQCNYGSCKSLGYVWEKCRERALEILAKRQELISRLDAQGVDVEKTLDVSLTRVPFLQKDVQQTRVEEPPKETSRQLAEKLPVPVAKLMSNAEGRPGPQRRKEQPHATRQPAAKRRKR
ncbi:MAG: hypothetical protein Q9185_000871 [Variospora sp. 1 TL-2023]